MSLDFDRLLTETQAAPLAGVSTRTLQFYRLRGLGPPYVKLSPAADACSGAIRYRLADIAAFVEQRALLSSSPAEIIDPELGAVTPPTRGFD